MTTQVLRRLEKIEASMAQREVPKPEFTLVFVDAADGRDGEQGERNET